MKVTFAFILLLPSTLAAGEIRLVKPDRMAGNGTGRVEVYHDGQWGTICDLGWDKNDAAVVCNQLGFVKVIHEAKNALYGQGSGPVWMGYVQCKGDEQRLTDCPNGGWGATSCKHVRDAGVKCLHEGVPQILEVGCYKDTVAQNKRALTDLYLNLRTEVDWYNMRSMVTRCAEGAHEMGYKYFGIQFFGECWGSKEGQLTFGIHGKGVECYEGVGGENHNFVYRFAPWKDLGCWRDEGHERTMTLLENFRSGIDWFHLEITVEKCYQAARKAGKKFFAVQFYGECWVGDDESYQNHGFSTNCIQGVGKHWANYVYKVMW